MIKNNTETSHTQTKRSKQKHLTQKKKKTPIRTERNVFHDPLMFLFPVLNFERSFARDRLSRQGGAFLLFLVQQNRGASLHSFINQQEKIL